jgi:hypothetical protein
MAATFGESQKLDYLWKKVGYGVAKTSIPPPGSGSKEAYNESIPSPLLYRGDLVWTNSGDIPASPPSNTTSIVQVYKDGGGGGYSATVQCTEDFTAPDNQTWKTNLTNWIPTQFGDNYLVVVYVDTTGSTTPQTTGTRLFQTGSGSDDTWFFDYQAGILNFNGATIPSVIAGGISGKSVFIVGYRYVGPIGVVGNAVLGNLTISNTTISSSLANATITLEPTGTGVVSIDTTTGLIIPVGNITQRPGYPTYSATSLATIRYNNDYNYLEYYDGTEWLEVGVGAGGAIADQQITPDGTSVTYTLTQDTDQTSILVAINGVGQIPGSAYSVTGNLITFSEAPLTSDAIDIRFLASASVTSKIINGAGTTYVETTGANTVVSNVLGTNIMVVSSTGVSVVGNVVTNNISADQSLTLPSYTVAQSANISAPLAGQVIYVSNGDAGNPCLAVYSSGAWKRVSLGANISAT